MNADFWNDVEALFADIVGLPAHERTALLDLRTTGRPDLRAEVESLLASHDAADRFLQTPAGEFDDDRMTHATPVGGLVGRFRLVEKIGEGGMGVVYRAERADGEFHERVAVKLIAVAFQPEETLRRFRIERQILATLNHPDIVTLLDAGVTESGQAFLAMQLVDGVPITDYCSSNSVLLEPRVRLFQRVCAAVQHAHQSGVVHRDLKPANILVTAEGIPKVLDFGVAKLLDPAGKAVDATGTILFRPLTPNYASPEQLRGLPVTTACDVYALGVLLYELLAGQRPYDTTGQPLDEVLATVVESEPRRPSDALAGQLPYDVRRLRGDLDAIVLKAMSKEPARRYASAQELAEDLSRHLSGLPVLAREPSLAYTVSSLARRHRPAFAAAAVSILALATALAVSLWQTRLAVAERHRADARFNEVRQLANALIFKIHDQVQPLPGSTPVRQTIVAEGLTYLEMISQDALNDPDLLLELGKAYRRIGSIQGNQSEPNLGDPKGALGSLRRALALLRPLAVERRMREAELEYGRALVTLSSISETLAEERDESLRAAREATDYAEALVSRRDDDADARLLLGSAQFQLASRTGFPASLPHWQRAAEVFEQLLAEQPEDQNRRRNVALVARYLGTYFDTAQDDAEALRHYSRSRDLNELRLEAEPDNRSVQMDVAIDWTNVANARMRVNEPLDAVRGYDRALEVFSGLATADPNNAFAQYWLARVNTRLGEAHSVLGNHAHAVEHAREGVTKLEPLSAVSALYLGRHGEALAALAKIELAAGQPVPACRALQRASTVVADLTAGGAPDESLHPIRARLDPLKPAMPDCQLSSH